MALQVKGDMENWNKLMHFDVKPMTEYYYDMVSTKSLINWAESLKDHDHTYQTF